MRNRDKKLNQYLGASGEDAAVKLMKDRGFNILRRNYRVHNVGEIDIIGEMNGDIHIFEVRTRLNIGAYPDSAESVIRSKRNKVIKTAERFIENYGLYDRNVIFEVVSVTHDRSGKIIKVDFIPF